MPIVEAYGAPALIIFDSNTWVGSCLVCAHMYADYVRQDQLYFWQRAQYLGFASKAPSARGGYTWRELQYHRERVTAMIGTLRTAFPRASIMWKPTHVRALSTIEFGRTPMQGSMDIHHINQSLRALMHLLRVPVLECASILTAPISSVARRG